MKTTAPIQPCVLLSWAVIGCFATYFAATAQQVALPASAEPLDATSEFAVETVSEGLHNPCGLSIRSGSRSEEQHELFFAESGAGRIVTASTAQPDQITPVVEGFPTGPWVLAEGRQLGPLGTSFLTPGKLAVGYGGSTRGQAAVRVFLLGDADPPPEPLPFAEMDHEVLATAVRGDEEKAAYQFFGLAQNDNALFAAGGGDREANWILMATLLKNKLSDLQPHIDAREMVGVARPVAVTIDERAGAGYLVAGQMGEVSATRDSVLAFYAPRSGRLAAAFSAGLYDLLDVAYATPSGNLYAVDAAWHDPEAGGVYRLDATTVDGKQRCVAVRIAACPRPTSLAFTPSGTTLYVTTFGPEDQQRDGKLLRITGGF